MFLTIHVRSPLSFKTYKIEVNRIPMTQSINHAFRFECLVGLQVSADIVLEVKGLLPQFIYSDVPDYYIQASEVDRRLVGKEVKNKRILNVGCGSKLISDAYFAALGAKVVGVDFDDKAVVEANEKIRKLGNLDIEVLYGDGRKLDFADESFDIVVSYSSIEHMESYSDRLLAIKEMKRVTKKNGLIAITGPNMLNLATTLLSHLLFNSGENHYYEHRYTPWEMKRMLTINGLQIVRYDAESVYIVDETLIKNRLPWLQGLPIHYRSLSTFMKFLNSKPFKLFGQRMGYLARKP